MFQIAAIVAILVLAADTRASAAEPSPEPKITSIYPFGAQMGRTYQATVRGSKLKDARSLWFPKAGIQARVLNVTSPDATQDVLLAELTVDGNASAGRHAFRVVTPAGVSNEIALEVSSAGSNTETAADEPISKFPATIEGRIAQPGAVNSYPISVQPGQTVTFEVHSGYRELDPSIAIAERSGSWFDPQRVNRIAFNDEPLFFPGLSTNARLVHRFDRAGTYVVQVASASGQGSPDHVYELRMIPGVTPAPDLHPHWTDLWEERQFTRAMGSHWLSQIAARGSEGAGPKDVESFRAVKEGAATIPVLTPPGLVEGRIAQPGEAHVIQVKVDKAQDLAIEIETPEATMPRFNPVVRLTESNGNEIVTDVYTKLNNNGLYMMKMIEAKTVFSLGAPGVYTLQIRDITTDRAGADFAYRVLIRPQIPHIGKVTCSEDRLNLQPGASKTLTVTLEREEEFGGVVALAADNLPPGVTALPAMEKPVERPPLPNGGRLERYVPKPQTASLLLVTSPDAPVSEQPVVIHVTARPIVNGRLGNPIPVGDLPVMVIARRPS
ncbi:MAG: hypothetical protein ABJF23_00040 [Bryobacteraceae bacterium]